MKILSFISIVICVICALYFDYYAYVSYTPTSLLNIGDRVIVCMLADIMFSGLGCMMYSLRD